MSKVVDAEKKRGQFRLGYRDVLVEAASVDGASVVLQGTLAPDRIESGATGGALIKTHHNVGLNLDGLDQMHPLASLFKYEVRELARAMGLPESVWKRQPFPGPGLFIRVLGVPATPDRLEVVRWADARVKEIVWRHGLYDEISQLIVALAGLNTVGVKGDGRVYSPAILVRGIKTLDFMTGSGVRLPNEVKDEIEAVVLQHAGITRIWYDETDKPPGTTEFE